jgi:hypothetical protein
MRAALVLVPLLFASPAFAQLKAFDGPFQPIGDDADVENSADIEAFGVLRRIGLICNAFETDSGQLFVLNDYGGFVVGDRVFVRGSFSTIGVCGSLILSRLANTIEAAFAGTGTIVTDRVLGRALETPEGARYKLVSPLDFGVGEEVFVRGTVRTRVSPITGQTEYWIFSSVIGTAFTGFGRLSGGAGSFDVELEGGTTFQLDGPGYAFAADGDYVFVEGLVDSTTTPPTLRHNASRKAHQVPGEIIDGGGGVPAFKAETVIFNDVFSLLDFEGFQIGERAFVRGRKLDDYDPQEVRSNVIRDARIDFEFSACGTIAPDLVGTGVSFYATSGEVFELEHTGGFASGQLVYVAGGLDATLTRYASNVIAPCAELQGTLQHGFECTPLFVSNASAGESGSFFLLENLGGYQVGEALCVLGGIMACDIGCPTPCMVANTTSDCTQ